MFILPIFIIHLLIYSIIMGDYKLSKASAQRKYYKMFEMTDEYIDKYTPTKEERSYGINKACLDKEYKKQMEEEIGISLSPSMLYLVIMLTEKNKIPYGITEKCLTSIPATREVDCIFMEWFAKKMKDVNFPCRVEFSCQSVQLFRDHQKGRCKNISRDVNINVLDPNFRDVAMEHATGNKATVGYFVFPPYTVYKNTHSKYTLSKGSPYLSMGGK